MSLDVATDKNTKYIEICIYVKSYKVLTIIEINTKKETGKYFSVNTLSKTTTESFRILIFSECCNCILLIFSNFRAVKTKNLVHIETVITKDHDMPKQ